MKLFLLFILLLCENTFKCRSRNIYNPNGQKKVAKILLRLQVELYICLSGQRISYLYVCNFVAKENWNVSYRGNTPGIYLRVRKNKIKINSVNKWKRCSIYSRTVCWMSMQVHAVFFLIHFFAAVQILMYPKGAFLPTNNANSRGRECKNV